MTDEPINAREYKLVLQIDKELTEKLAPVPIFILRVSRHQEINKKIIGKQYFNYQKKIKEDLGINNYRANYLWSFISSTVIIRRGAVLRLQVVLELVAFYFIYRFIWDTEVITILQNFLKQIWM